jgi:hypothetical protein
VRPLVADLVAEKYCVFGITLACVFGITLACVFGITLACVFGITLVQAKCQVFLAKVLRPSIVSSALRLSETCDAPNTNTFMIGHSLSFVGVF